MHLGKTLTLDIRLQEAVVAFKKALIPDMVDQHEMVVSVDSQEAATAYAEQKTQQMERTQEQTRMEREKTHEILHDPHFAWMQTEEHKYQKALRSLGVEVEQVIMPLAAIVQASVEEELGVEPALTPAAAMPAREAMPPPAVAA